MKLILFIMLRVVMVLINELEYSLNINKRGWKCFYERFLLRGNNEISERKNATVLKSEEPSMSADL